MKPLITEKVRCGTCDLTVPIPDSPLGRMWCRGGPPSAEVEITLDISGPGQPPLQKKNITGYYPPVEKDSIGCALHPAVRERLRRGR